MNNPNPENFNNQNNSQYGFVDSGYDMYSSNYGSIPPKKNNNNILIIILISVVAFLLCAIIALTAILILKPGNKNTQTQTKKSTQTTQTNSGVPKNAAKKNNNTYVTCVSNAEVYVRSGPDKSNSIVLKIKGGDTSVKLKSTGNSTFGTDGFIWYEVTIPSGQTAWVRSDVVTLDGPNPYQRKAVKDSTVSTGSISSGTTLVTKSQISRIFVRSGPSKSYSVIYIIAAGDTSKKLVTTGVSQKDSSGYTWYQVITPANQVAWVRNDVVTQQKKSIYVYSGTTLVTKSYKSKIFVRSGPSKGYKVVYTIAAGDTSKKLITTGTAQYDSSGYLWYQVRTPAGQIAWVRNDIVTFSSSGGGGNGGQISVSGGTLVTKSYNSKIYVRSGPSKSYSIVYTIATGDTSKKLTKTGTGQYDSSGYLWYQVRTPSGQTAWVRSDIVTTSSSSSYSGGSTSYSGSSGTLVTRSYSSLIYVRSGPGKNYKVVYSIGAGDTSQKLRYTGSSQRGSDGYVWYNVIAPNGANAWVRSDIVQFQ